MCFDDIVHYTVKGYDEERPTLSRDIKTEVHEQVKRTRSNSSAKKIGKPNGYKRLSVWCILQVVLSRKEIRQLFISKGQHRITSMQIIYFAPVLFLQRGDETIIGIYVHYKLHDPKILYISGGLVSTDQLKLVQMWSSGRRIGLFHWCAFVQHSAGGDICCIEPSLSVLHSGDLFNGKLMTDQRKSNWYPPRIA